MKISLNQKSARKGFTLIEMIGVLAVIAILASLLIPKIFEAINNARISNAALSYNSIKTATADHYAKFGTLPLTNFFDRTLVSEGFADKAFTVKIGADPVAAAGGTQRVDIVTAVGATLPTTIDSAFALDGGVVNLAVGSAVVEAVIPGVLESDARALSLLLDGASMSTAIGTSDIVGRVKYATGSPTTVYVYVTHR